MPAIRIQEGASLRIDDIYRYTSDRWGEDQADKYITGLFEAFDKIATRGVAFVFMRASGVSCTCVVAVARLCEAKSAAQSAGP